jgi:hypothetical protein
MVVRPQFKEFLKGINWSDVLVKSAFGIFAIAVIAQILGGYILNRMEENRKKRDPSV